MDGVLINSINALSDDTVEVGADLYELDTDAESTVEAGASSPGDVSISKETKKVSNTPVTVPVPTPVKTAAPPTSASVKKTQQQQQRVPSIQFLGKEGWSHKLAGIPELPPLPTNFGRPAFTEEEMEALLTGGANMVPNVKQHSSGAIFG